MDTDRSIEHLRARVDRLEQFAITALVLAALVPMLVGWMLPWITEEHEDRATTYRLITAAFQFHDPSPGSSSPSSNDLIFSVIMTISYALLDVVTVATAIMLLTMRSRSWTALKTGNLIVGLGLVCIVGVWLTTLLAVGNADDSGAQAHLTPIICWSIGIVLAALAYHSSAPRSWWQVRPATRRTVAPVVVSRATPEG